ncbi:hypothetical protein ACQ4N7_25745 [Nodosilinea sp. AN01ver1]|uniref:hypothetical protein n=1 Tax=Nodosilinea sp. AN01ver1 TaxID=3423362 RepID=UPI003D31128B
MLSHRNSHQDWPSDRRRHQPLAWNRLWRSLLTLSVAGLGLALRPTVAHASLARIMTISGSVQLRREAWSEFRRANPGTALYGPDLLEPGRGSRIVVICSNGSRWVVPAGTISAVNNGCPGTLYTLVVETDTGALSTDDPPTLRFNLLTGDRVEAAQTDIAAVEAMDLPDMVATLILVEDVYPR